MYRWLGDNAKSIVSAPITDTTFDFLDQQDTKGRIPSPYNEEFVKNILNEEICICGAKLEFNSEQRERVASMLQSAADLTLRDRITRIRAQVSSLKTERAKGPSQLRRLRLQLSELDGDVASREAKLNEISKKLKGVKVEDISERESRRQQLIDDLNYSNNRVGRIEKELIDSGAELLGIEEDLKRLAESNRQAKIYSDRSSLCEDILKDLTSRLASEEINARKILREKNKWNLKHHIKKIT